MRDMFGHEVTLPSADAPALTPRERRKLFRKPTVPDGYAWKPGTGPAGETCGSCKHLVRKQLAGTYLKCGLMEAVWTGGAKTDVRSRSPACAKWEPKGANNVSVGLV
jgi:hypothetical protein